MHESDFGGAREVEKYMHRFQTALSWLWDHHDGQVFAFRLWLRLKLEMFHGENENIRGRARADGLRLVNYILDGILGRIKQHPVHLYVRGKRQDMPFIDAALAYRRIRNISKNFDRRHCQDRERKCIHEETAPALAKLRRHAIIEIKSNASRAVGKRLPREIVDMVVEHALAIEEVPVEPPEEERRTPRSVFERMLRGSICSYGVDSPRHR